MKSYNMPMNNAVK